MKNCGKREIQAHVSSTAQQWTHAGKLDMANSEDTQRRLKSTVLCEPSSHIITYRVGGDETPIMG
eukprot:2028738-Amphidinium_carterae.2